MRKPPIRATSISEVVTVLSVSPIEEDHTVLGCIFKQPEWNTYTGATWSLTPVLTLEAAIVELRCNSISIVLSESDLLPGSWKEVLAEIGKAPNPPLLVVTSRLADDYLWAEALNIGAYDVLAKPFDATEVIRIVSLAWLRRKRASLSQSSPTAIARTAAAG
jgi:DNA-binding response OmpR family regulator